MNILQVNKFFYIRDGTSRYFLNLSNLLKKRGHDVLSFSMHHPRNFPSLYSKYFVSNLSFTDKANLNLFRVIPRIFYSIEASKKIKILLEKQRIDLVHIHSIYHHLSPSILVELKRRRIPVVMTAHDYHLIAPNYLLFHNSRICEITKPGKYYKALFHRCIRDSYLFSLLEVIEKYFNNIIIKERDLIDIIIVPSRFVKNIFIEYGYPEYKIIVLPFFINSNRKIREGRGKYVLYFGGLYEQKGVEFLLRVMKNLPNIPCLVVGEGPEEDKLKKIINEKKIRNVKLLGYKEQSDLDQIISLSRFTIMPSLWYEGFGLVNLEANACGKPVVATNIGGIPEVIKDKFNGLLFEPGNVEDCRDKILTLWNNRELLMKMGRQAQSIVREKFNPNKHYKKLLKIYQQLIS